MNNLHDLRGPNMTRWIWYRINGSNGRAIGGGIAHAFPVERGQPPVPVDPAGGRDPWARQGWQRQGWNPYQIVQGWANGPEAVAMLRRAACAGIKSASRWPRFNPAWEGQRICQDCVTAAPQAVHAQTAAQNDPWNNIPWNERGFTIDPISGV